MSTVETILNKGNKGPKPNLGKFLEGFLAKHGRRIPSGDFDAVIAKLTEQRNTNVQTEVKVAQELAEAATKAAAELAAKAVAVTATPSTATAPAVA